MLQTSGAAVNVTDKGGAAVMRETHIGGLRARMSLLATRRHLSDRGKEAVLGYAMMSPWLLGFLAFVAGPMILSVVISLFDTSELIAPYNVPAARLILPLLISSTFLMIP